MSAKSFVPGTFEPETMDQSSLHRAYAGGDFSQSTLTAHPTASLARPPLHLIAKPVSPWVQSKRKRLFDCACVLLAMPLVVPVFLVIAVAVWLTSSGPVLFLQKRMGRHGQLFTILKFRTLTHKVDKAHHAVTTAGNQCFTPVGPFLRRWKLDELPQLLNVLWGDMSLVGSRPKMPEHLISDLPWRPGITGAATIAFAREEAVLDRVPKHLLEFYYHTVVLPAKRQLDAEYMASATFSSDLKLIIDSVMRRWDNSVIEGLLNVGESLEEESRVPHSRKSPLLVATTVTPRMPIPHSVDRPAQAERISAY